MSKLKSAPAQFKQPSRKGKKAWRKNVDITDIQSGLEALRDEITQGGPVAEKTSDELFALDTTGSEEIKQRHKLSKPLKVDEILAKRSAVPAVDSRKRGGITDGVVEPSSKRLKGDWVSKREVARLKQVADRTSHLDSSQIEEELPDFDLWATGSGYHLHDLAMWCVPRAEPKVAPATIKQSPIPMTANGKPVKAINNPDAGTSYNPAFEEWDDLLNRKGTEEVAAEQARIAQAEAEAERQARIAALVADDSGVRTDNESEWEGFETEPEDTETFRQKQQRRKTPAERNKIKRRKEAEQLAKHQKRTADNEQRAQDAATNMLAVVENDDMSGALTQDVETSEEDGHEAKPRRRKLGNVPIPEKNLELVLPDELQDSLRLLKPEGNLLQDRFHNLLMNGKIESRKPVLQSKKKRTKVTEKWSYKDFSVPI